MWDKIGISKSFLIYVLHHPDHRIQRHRHNAQQHDRHDQPIHLEHLARINDQVPQPVPRRQEFPDHHPDQAKPDIDLHIADHSRHGARQHDFKKRMPPRPVQGIDQLDLFPVDSGEAGVQVHDTAEYRHGHAGDDDGRGGGAQPYDKKRCEGGFRQAVQDDQIGLQYLGELPAAPEKDSDKDAEQCDEQEADNGFIQCDADMQEDRAVCDHFPKAESDLGRTAEDKGINDPCICTDFPQDEEEHQDHYPRKTHDQAVAAQAGEKQFLPM